MKKGKTLNFLCLIAASLKKVQFQNDTFMWKFSKNLWWLARIYPNCLNATFLKFIDKFKFKSYNLSKGLSVFFPPLFRNDKVLSLNKLIITKATKLCENSCA